MGFYSTQSPVNYENLSQFARTAPTTDQRQYASSYVTQLNDRSLLGTVGAAVGFAVPDLVDTISSSLGATERGAINQKVLSAFGTPGVNAWYESNKGAIEFGSSIAGIALSTVVARGILRPTGAAMRGLQGLNLPVIRNIATLDSQLESARRLAMVTQRVVAKEGASGVERFAGGEMILSRLGQAGLRTSRGASTKALYRASAAKTLTENALIEGIMAATLNENSLLYDDDLTHNLTWMAGGLVAGQAIDSLVTTYALRKMATSEATRQLNRKAFDISGFESGRVSAFTAADSLLREAGVPTTGFMFKGSGGVTDVVTSYSIQASELSRQRGTTQSAARLGANRESAATPIRKISFDLMQKVTPRGLRGVADSGFHMDTAGLGPVVRESLERDPKSMLGIEELGQVPEGLTVERVDSMRSDLFKRELEPLREVMNNNGILKTTKTKDGKWIDTWKPLTEEQRLSIRDKINELVFSGSHVGKVMLEPGEWAPLSHAKIAEGYTPIKPEFEGTLSKKDPRAFWTTKWGRKRSERLSIGDDGSFILPEGRKAWKDLSNPEMLHAFAAAQALVTHHIRHQVPFKVQPKATWMQLDIAERIAKSTNGGEHLVAWLDPKMTRQMAQLESFAQKVDAIKGQTKDLSTLSPEEIFALKVRYNLPRIDSFHAALLNTDEHPLDLLLAGFTSGKQVREAGLQEVMKAFNDSRMIKGLTDETMDALDSIEGNSFNFLKDRDGNPIGPIIGYQRPLNPHEWVKDTLLMRHVVKESLTQAELSGPNADPLTRQLFDYLSTSPASTQARKVMELADDQHRSFIPGFRHAAPQSTLGALVNAVTPKGRRDVDSIAMLAASQVQDLKARFSQTAAKQLFENAMGDSISVINSPRNAKSLMLLNQTMSYGRGWEFLDEASSIPLPDGATGFALRLDPNSRLNQQRFREQFGREMNLNGEVLRTPNDVEAVMDQMAFDTFKRFQGVTNTILSAKNTLLRSQGLPQISKAAWYIPPPSLEGKYVAYTFDSNNNIVKGLTAIADSPEELSRMRTELTGSPLWRDGYRTRSKDDIGEFMSLWDKAQMDWYDPLTTPIQPGKVNRGGLAGPTIDHQTFNQSLIRMRDQVLQHGNDLVEIMFDQPLKSARVRAETAKVETAQGRQTARHSSIYDRWTQNLLGTSSLSANDSFFGDASQWLENRINGFLNSPIGRAPAQAKAAASQMIDDWIRGAIPGRSPQGKQFDDMAKALGKYMPYKTVNEMLESQLESQTPADVKAIASKLSWFEASHRLRWLESAHGVINLTSMVANMPSVIRALQPMAGETIEQAAARNSSLTMIASLPNGNDVVIPNGMKLTWQSMLNAFGWNRKPIDPIIREAERRAYPLGFMNQEVAEMNRSLAAIDSRNDWRGVFFGDKMRKGNTVADRIARSGGIDKWAGILSDKSEDLSRQWGMHAGFLVGRAMGMTHPDDLIALGKELTDKMIANYDPKNRPEIFQGALGSLAGLFQSYMFNFYGRMFRYIETGDTRALATQAAMQTSIFGMGSLPGWHALNWAFFDRGFAKGEDPVDSFANRFGTNAGDLFLHGTVSNLPKLFGLDGAALYTRGDVTPRIPGTEWSMLGGVVPLPNFPVVDSLNRLWSGVTAGIAAAKIDSVDVGPRQWAEIAANTVANRPLAGLIEQTMAGGLDTSWDGQVVTRTQSTAEAVYRALGIRSMTQQKQVEAFYADKTAQEEQQARRDALNGATRAAIRDGRFADVPLLFEEYVKNGGDPRRYTAWRKDAVKAAMQTRSERRLNEALNDKTNRSNATIARLLDGEVGIREGELSVEDYGAEAALESVMQAAWEGTPLSEQSLDADDPIRGAPPIGGF